MLMTISEADGSEYSYGYDMEPDILEPDDTDLFFPPSSFYDVHPLIKKDKEINLSPYKYFYTIGKRNKNMFGRII